MRNIDPVSIELMRWAGFSHEKIFASVAGDGTNTESMHTAAAVLTDQHSNVLQVALRHAEAGFAEYRAASTGTAAEAGATAINASVDSLRTLVQSAAVVPDVISKVAERFDAAKAVIGGLPPKTTSRFDAEDLPMSWVLPPPADQMDSDEIENRQWVREAMAGYEQFVAGELKRLPAFVPVRQGLPAQAPATPPTLPPVRRPSADGGRRTSASSLMDQTTEPLLPVPPLRTTQSDWTQPAWRPQSAPGAAISWGDFGPTGHAAEDAEFAAQQPAGQTEPETRTGAEQRSAWRSDGEYKSPAERRQWSASVFEPEEKVAPPVIGFRLDESP